MFCIECNAECRERRGDFKETRRDAGEILVPDCQWHECPVCGEVFMDMAMADRLDQAYRKRLRELLLARSLPEFITASEAADMLGISRQALHKHRRIRRGFIHRVRRFGQWLYLKESVEAFNQTGDGRISIVSVRPPADLSRRVEKIAG